MQPPPLHQGNRSRQGLSFEESFSVEARSVSADRANHAPQGRRERIVKQQLSTTTALKISDQAAWETRHGGTRRPG